MKPNIGIISAVGSIENIKSIVSEFDDICTITCLTYTTMRQLLSVYDEHAFKFDGLMFSGALPMQYVVNRRGAIHKPHSYFDVSDRDFYKLIAHIVVQYPDIDLSKVSIELSAKNIDFNYIFGSDPPFIIETHPYIHPFKSNVYEEVLSSYIEQYKAGKLSLVASRLTNIAEAVERAGIKFIPIVPSSATMIDSLSDLVSQIQSQHVSNYLVVIGIVKMQELMAHKQRDEIRKLLEDYNQENNLAFLLNENRGGFELTTSNETLLDMTQGYTSCSLTNWIKLKSDLELCVGWGIGKEPLSARSRAEKAVRESARSANQYAYLVTEDEELVGPLALGKSVVLEMEPDENAELLGRQIGISAANLTKLMNIQEKRNINEFSSETLAFYLNIKQRSARRILSRLTECGMARVVRSEHKSSKGRPATIYEINLSASRK